MAMEPAEIQVVPKQLRWAGPAFQGGHNDSANVFLDFALC